MNDASYIQSVLYIKLFVMMNKFRSAHSNCAEDYPETRQTLLHSLVLLITGENHGKNF